MEIINICHDAVKNPGYVVNRPFGRTHYTFAYYSTAVQIRCADRSYTVQPGGCMIFSPGVSQWLYSDRELIHTWIHLSPAFQSMVEAYRIPLDEPFYPRVGASLSPLFHKMEAEFFGTAPYRELLLEGCLQELMILLHRALVSPARKQAAPHIPVEKFHRVRMTILSEPERRWTLEEMAALVPLSPSRFHNLYKTLFGITPTQELIQRRIDLAKDILLSESALTLAQIAELLGYREQYHFIRQFRSVTGQTPGAYRKNNT